MAVNTIDRLCKEIFHSAKGPGESAPKLGEEERELLLHSLPSGQFVLFESDHFGDHVATEDRHWYSDHDKTRQQLMVDAFRQLCGRGYVRHLRLCIFGLSQRGFNAAHELARTSDTAHVA